MGLGLAGDADLIHGLGLADEIEELLLGGKDMLGVLGVLDDVEEVLGRLPDREAPLGERGPEIGRGEEGQRIVGSMMLSEVGDGRDSRSRVTGGRLKSAAREIEEPGTP